MSNKENNDLKKFSITFFIIVGCLGLSMIASCENSQTVNNIIENSNSNTSANEQVSAATQIGGGNVAGDQINIGGNATIIHETTQVTNEVKQQIVKKTGHDDLKFAVSNPSIAELDDDGNLIFKKDGVVDLLVFDGKTNKLISSIRYEGQAINNTDVQPSFLMDDQPSVESDRELSIDTTNASKKVESNPGETESTPTPLPSSSPTQYYIPSPNSVSHAPDIAYTATVPTPIPTSTPTSTSTPSPNDSGEYNPYVN